MNAPSRGYWGRAWHGKVEHFWPNENRTLCGKRLTSHGRRPRPWYQKDVSRCKECEKRLERLEKLVPTSA